MALTDAEVESLRFHLGYGNIGIGAYPSTPDGFYELFSDVIAPNLTTGTETTSTTAVAAAGIQAVTPAAMTDIVVGARLYIDVGDDAEVVVVKSVSVTAFTARFTLTHPSSGYPVALDSGTARLRALLHTATRAWERKQSSSVTKTAGLKSVGQGEVEWFEGGKVLADTEAHYRAIVGEISRLVRVAPCDDGLGVVTQLEAY